MIALRPVDGQTLFPFLHAGALALWVAALGLPPAAGTHRLARFVRTAHRPAAAVALFTAIALFHRHPEHWFDVTGKTRALIVLAVLGLDAVRDAAAPPLASALAGPHRARAVAAALAGLVAVQVALTWVSPWKT